MTLFGRLAWDLRAAVRARLIYLARPSRRIREKDHEPDADPGELKRALNDKKTLLERREQLRRRDRRAREDIDARHAAHRIQSLDRNPLERTLELPAHDLDTFDFGL